MVRLQGTNAGKAAWAQMCFNSKMVRLQAVQQLSINA